MIGRQLHRELLAASVPSMGADNEGRIALGLPHKTPTGQWVVIPAGTTEWVGTGDPTPEPDAALLAQVAATKATHVPEAPQPPEPDRRIVMRALVKLARGRPEASLSQEELDHLDRAELGTGAT